LWGWFQFHTSLYERHGLQCRILQLLQLKAAPQLHAALAAALAELRNGSSSSSRCSRPGMLVVAHVRRGDFRELATQSTSNQHSNGSNACNDACHERPASGGSLKSQQQQKQQQQQQLCTEPPFEDGQQGAAWDSNGCDWRAPTAWLLDALAALQLDAAAGDVLWICSDDAVLLQKPEQLLQQTQNQNQQVDEQSIDPTAADKQQEQQQQLMPVVATWATVGMPAGLCSSSAVTAGAAGAAQDPTAAAASAAAAAAAGDAADAALLADWFVMSQADVLLASNSTLSFTAAMVNAAQRLSADGHKQSSASTAAAAPAAGSASSPTTTAGAVATDSASSAAAAVRVPMFLRPDPRQCCYVPFDPWDALPLLPARATLPGNHRLHSERV
jgi:hypothetical protein